MVAYFLNRIEPSRQQEMRAVNDEDLHSTRSSSVILDFLQYNCIFVV